MRSSYLLLVALLVTDCGKNIFQTILRPSVDTRVSDSTSGTLTAPRSAIQSDTVQATQFNFAVFGDPQIHSDGNTLISRFKQDISSREIDFVAIAGDITEDATFTQYDQIKAQLDDLGIPYYMTIGNHDLFQDPDEGGWNAWKERFGPATYSLSMGNEVRFIFIDTASGDVGGQQFEWLESQLKTRVPYTFVVSHYPIYDGQTPRIFRLESYEERYRLTSILNRYGVYAYISGHLHGYAHGNIGSVQHFIVGSMYPKELDLGTHGYVLFNYLNGQMSWQWIDFDGGANANFSWGTRVQMAFGGIMGFLRDLLALQL